MALTKGVTAVYSGQSIAASGGPTTSSAATISDAYAAALAVKLTNGATGPTTPATVQIQVSGDNSEFYDLGGPLVGSTVNSAVVSWVVDLPTSALYVRTVTVHPTGQAVTLDADLTEVTAL